MIMVAWLSGIMSLVIIARFAFKLRVVTVSGGVIMGEDDSDIGKTTPSENNRRSMPLYRLALALPA